MQLSLISPSFLLGMLIVLNLPSLPSKAIILGCVALGIIGVVVTQKVGKLKLPLLSLSIMLLGASWFMYHTHSLLQWQLPTQWQNAPLQATGRIVSLPVNKYGQQQFAMQLERLCEGRECQSFHTSRPPATCSRDPERGSECRDPTDKPRDDGPKILLNWQKPPQPLIIGQRWQLWIKLKPPRSYANPGSFDHAKWLFQNSIRATGYVISRPLNNISLSSSSRDLFAGSMFFTPQGSIRQQADTAVTTQLTNRPFAGVISALTLGNSAAISQEQWHVFRNTGTSHLVAISGLHIGMIAAVVYWLFAHIWRLFPRLCLRCPAPQIGAICGIGGALAYSVLSGFSIPAQRSLIMIVVWMSALLWRRHVTMLHRFMLGLLLVLLLDPLAVMNMGFWLSFGAIAMIGYGMSCRLTTNTLWWKWGRVQWVASVGLMPLSWLLFQQTSIVGWFANFIAIPWVGWITVPLALLGCALLPFWQTGSYACLLLAEKTMEWLWPYLNYLSNVHFNSWYLAFSSPWLIVVSMIAVLLLLAPTAMPARWLAIIWFLPVFYIKPTKLPIAAVRVTTLDVGQGLSVLVETRNHRLIYDTGMGYPDGYNLGDVVVIPFLRATHITQLDKMIISHADADHAGGVAAMLRWFPSLPMLTSAPARFASYKQVAVCQQGQHWQWDSVEFTMLYPTHDQLTLGNDSSCVLQVRTGDKTVLLTGDIEHRAEQSLVQLYGDTLRSSILFAPHHGSKTSSTAGFIEKIKPELVIFSTGYLNRYHFPHPLVQQRYAELGIKTLNTAETGAITLMLQPQQPIKLETYRQQVKHFWE